jgi:hypothetical protein
MASVTISLTGLDGLQRMQQFVNPALFSKAQQGGVSYASKAVPPAVAKGIAAGYNIASARIKKDISGIRFASDRQSATIGFSKRSPTLVQFKPTLGTRGHQPGLGRGLGWGPPSPPGKPVMATILRGKRQSFPGVFITTGNSGNQIALRRTSNGGLQSVYGPSIGSIFAGQSAIGPQLRSSVEARINEQFIKGFQRVIDSAMRGYGR